MSSPYRKWDHYDVDKELEQIEKDSRIELLLKPLGNATGSSSDAVVKAADASIAKREVEVMKTKVPLHKRKLYRTISSFPSSVTTKDSSKSTIECVHDIETKCKPVEDTLASQFAAVTDSLQKLYHLVIVNSITNYQKGYNLAIKILNNVSGILKLLVLEKNGSSGDVDSIDTHILHYLLTQTTSYLSICSLNIKEYAVCINLSRMNILLNQMEYEDVKKGNGSASTTAASRAKKSRFVEAMNWVARGCAFFFCGGYYSAYRQLLSAQAIHPTFSGLALVLEEVVAKLREQDSFTEKCAGLSRELMFILRRQQQIENDQSNDTCIDINNDLSLRYLDTSLYRNESDIMSLKSSDELVSEFIMHARLLRENILLVVKIFYEAQTFFCENLYYTAEIKYIALVLLLERMIGSGLYNNKALDKLLAACFFNAAVCRTQRIALDTLHIHNEDDPGTFKMDAHGLLHCSSKQLILQGLHRYDCFEGMLRLVHYCEKVERYDEAYSLLSEMLEFVSCSTFASCGDFFVWDYGKGSLLDHKFLSSPPIHLFHVNEVNQLTVGYSIEGEKQGKQEILVSKIEAKMKHMKYLMKTYM